MKRFILILVAVALLQPLSLLQPQEASAANFRDLLTCPLYSTVYYISQDSERWIIPNEPTYFTWFDDFDDVVEVDCQVFEDIPLGQIVAYQQGTRLLKQQSSPEVYAVEPGGVLKQIVNEDQAVQLYGPTWNQRIDDINDAFWWTYSDFSNLTLGQYPIGTYLRDTNTGWHFMKYSDGVRAIGEERVTDIQKRYALEVNINALADGIDVTSDFWNDMTDLAYRPTEEEINDIEDDLADAPADETDTTPSGPAEDIIGFGTPTLVDPGETTISDLQYTLRWNTITEAESYRLEEDDNPNFNTPTLIYSGNQTIFRTQRSVTEEKTYYYRIKAKENSNFTKFSDYSNIVEITIKPYYIIADVPSEFQPPTRTLFSDDDDFSAPFAAAHVFSYHNEQNTDGVSDGVSADLEIETLAEYIGWFMDTNNEGSDDRMNNGNDGTLNGDLKDGLIDFTQWDGTTDATFDVPNQELTDKTSHLWNFTYLDSTNAGPGSAWDRFVANILDNKPVLAVFKYWNISEPDINTRLDDIDFWVWDEEINDSKDFGISAGDPPDEDWDFQEGVHGIGHAVTIVGIIPDFDIDADGDEDTDQSVDWVVVHDTWSNTPRQLAIPFDFWRAAVLISPN